jgi:hypothetical protein
MSNESSVDNVRNATRVIERIVGANVSVAAELAAEKKKNQQLEARIAAITNAIKEAYANARRAAGEEVEVAVVSEEVVSRSESSSDDDDEKVKVVLRKPPRVSVPEDEEIETTFTCQHCPGRVFAKLANLRSHEKSHAPKASECGCKCPKCGSLFSSMRYLKRHTNLKH